MKIFSGTFKRKRCLAAKPLESKWPVGAAWSRPSSLGPSVLSLFRSVPAAPPPQEAPRDIQAASCDETCFCNNFILPEFGRRIWVAHSEARGMRCPFRVSRPEGSEDLYCMFYMDVSGGERGSVAAWEPDRRQVSPRSLCGSGPPGTPAR